MRRKFKQAILGLIIMVLSIILFSAIYGCDTSSGGGNDGTTPKITNVLTYSWPDYTRTNTYQGGDKAYWYIYANDPDLDIVSVTTTIYYYNSDRTYFGPTTDDLSSQTDERIVIYPRAPYEVLDPPGRYTIGFQVEDAKGNLSNEFRVVIYVEE